MFRVDGRPYRPRRFLDDKDEALALADTWERERSNQGIEAMELPTRLRVQAMEAEGLLRPYGHTITDAVRFFVRHLEDEKRRSSLPTVSEALSTWIDAKRRQLTDGQISGRTFQELSNRAVHFRAAFDGQRIDEINPECAEQFVIQRAVCARTRLNLRTKLAQFFNYCRKRNWVSKNPAESVEIRVPPHEVSILSAADCESLLSAAHASEFAETIVPYVAVGLFVGLRPGEAQNLRWEHVRFESQQLEVRHETSKGRETRFPQLDPVAMTWLEPYRKPRGKMINDRFRDEWEAVRTDAGYQFGNGAKTPWPQDVLRHCFGSYWLAKHNDRPRLAELMGNSVEVIKKHYRRALSREEVDAFWALRPK